MSILQTIVRCAIHPTDLDDPSLSYLCDLIDEEVSFIQTIPGSMTRAQLAHLLATKLEEQLLSFELVKDDAGAIKLCDDMVQRLEEQKLIQLCPQHSEDENTSSSSSSSSATLTTASLASSSSSPTPPKLSAPVRLLDLAASEEEKIAQIEVTMAKLHRAAAKWSDDEEKVIFQSLADTHYDDDEDDDEESEQESVEGLCEMCFRAMPLTRHHLIPRMVHKHAPYVKMDNDHLNKTILICRPCHSAIHKFEDEKTLASKFNTLQLLMADERVQKWVAYISKRKVNRSAADIASGRKLRYGR